MYITITNGKPQNYSLDQLRKDNPQTSFPAKPSSNALAEFGVYEVNVLAAPKYDKRIQTLKQSDFYQVNGKWQMHYIVEPLPVFHAQKSMRAERDKLLSESDWVVTKAYETQTTVASEWLVYRQQLRDITKQEGFPYNIVWPVKP